MKETLKFGWKPDLPDHRTRCSRLGLMFFGSYQPRLICARAALRSMTNVSSVACTANTITRTIQFGRKKAKQVPDFVPSQSFFYLLQRARF